MKNFLTLFALVMFIQQANSKPVNPELAMKVGKNFLMQQTSSEKFKSGVVLELVKTEKSKSAINTSNSAPLTFYYIFNVSNGEGFVIVSGDDYAEPVLAYSDESDFNITNIAPQTQKWLQGYRDELRYISSTDQIHPTADIILKWQSLTEGRAQQQSFGKKNAAVSPLVQTKWDQSPFYNTLCPYDFLANERTVTGCVATAMAQIMKFWNYPQSGSGFHSYNHGRYGTLTADFGSTTYQWSSMPNNVTSSNTAVATLMYQCGVSVDMNYDIASRGGSGAYVISSQSPITNCSEYALETHFGYKNTLQGISRSNYTSTQWLNLMKGELDAGRPILYAGFGNGGGHAFVCDGYDNNNFLHFNWGWSGQFDGYFSMNALNPGGVGTGGGTGGFNSGHQAVIGIEPPSSNQTFNLNITVDVTPSANTIYYNAPFSVTTNIENKGTNTFNGDFCAAVFDAENIFIDYVEIKTGMSLSGGFTYQNNLVFSSSGTLSILPADDYKIMIFYRPTGGEWKRIFASGIFTDDYAMLDVEFPNDIEMYEDMVTSPSNIYKGQPLTVELNVLNDVSTSFLGVLDLSLYDLEGNFVTLIEQKANINLPANNTFTNGLTFSTQNLNVAAGTYLMALQYKRNGSTDFELVGSSYHQNPIKVIVSEPPFSPDAYENNNVSAQSFNLILSFSGANAVKATTGSNFHVGNDYDYYKVNLPAGYTYTLNPRLHDSYDSNNGQSYSADALFSYSTDGSTWSDAFDDVIDNPIVVNGGRTVYFLVSPYFTGDVGTYLLDMQISRAQNVGIDEGQANKTGITMYPNPATAVIKLMADEATIIHEVLFYDINGRKVLTSKWEDEIDISSLASGVYTVMINSNQGAINKKLTVIK